MVLPKIRLHQLFFSFLILFLPVQLGKHFWPDWTRILGLRLDYLSPTIYFTDILIFGILTSWGLDKIKNKNEKRKNTKKNIKIFNFRLLFYIFLFSLFILVNCFFAKNQPAAFYKLIKIIEFSLLGFYIAKNSFQIENFTRRFGRQISIAVVYSSLLAIAQFLKQGSLGGIFYWLGERSFNSGTSGIAQTISNGQLLLRPYATFPHPNVLAGFLVVSLLLIIIKNRQNNTAVVICPIILGTIALFLTFSHTAWVVFGIALLVKTFYRKTRNSKKKIFIISVFLLSTFYFLLSTFPIQPESIVYRQDLNFAAIKMWQSSPLVGVGLNNFLVRLPEFYQSHGEIRWFQPAHNLFLMVLSETGLIGLIGLIWFLVKTISRLLRTTNHQLLIVVVVILALGFFDHYFYTLQQGQLFMTLVFGLAWSKSLQNGKM